MDLDEQELLETRKKKGLKKDCVNKETIKRIIQNHIWEIDNEEWDIPNAKEIKFYVKEELESVMFKLLKVEE